MLVEQNKASQEGSGQRKGSSSAIAVRGLGLRCPRAADSRSRSLVSDRTGFRGQVHDGEGVSGFREVVPPGVPAAFFGQRPEARRPGLDEREGCHRARLSDLGVSGIRHRQGREHDRGDLGGGLAVGLGRRQRVSVFHTHTHTHTHTRPSSRS